MASIEPANLRPGPLTDPARGQTLSPAHDPLRIAEDAATLATLTRGRFRLGVGLGYRAFGRALRQRPSLLEESVEVLRRAWSGAPVSFRAAASRSRRCESRPFPSAHRRS